jgi:subtilisin
MVKESRSHSNINSEFLFAAITLIVLLFSNSIFSPVFQTFLKEVEAQLVDTASLKDKIDALKKDADFMTKKFKEVKGQKIPNHYVVVLKQGNFLSSSVMSSAVKAINQGATIRHIYDHALDGFAIKVPNNYVLAAVMKMPEVDYVEPDVLVRTFTQSLPTGIDRVDGDLSSTKSGDGTGIVNADIGIMDSGVDLNHPDLNVYKQVTFVSGTTSGNDDNGHGTSVAGIAAAKDDSQGVVGIAPGARIWSIKVLNSNGVGSISDIIKGIDYVTQHANEIDVVNLSFGGDGSSDALHNAIIKSVAAGVTYAAAGGNEAKDASSVIPASYPEVVAVSAIVDTDGKCGGTSAIQTTAGKDDTLADFSNFGPVIDMAAPGVLIKTTAKGSSYTNGFSGTSASTPHVTGAAALYKSEHPGASPSDVRTALRNLGSQSTTICDGKGHGYFTGDHDNIAEPLLYTGVQSPYNYDPSLTLTGSNYVDVASSPSLKLSQFSVAAWFKTSADYNADAEIVNKGGVGSDTAGQNMNFGIWMTSAETIRAGFETSTGADRFATSPNKYNDNQWHYAVVTYGGSGVRLYIDGAQVGSFPATESPDTSGTQPVRVGANSRVTPPTSEFFIGNIDEVRVWNDDLTATEVSNAFAGTSFNTAEQVLYLSFTNGPAGLTGGYSYVPSLTMSGPISGDH